ncbi:MAG: redox-regulated ATPase YchF [Bacillota bacterium]
MRLGLVGLPNAGKSTLFNLITGAGAEVGHYPFTTVDGSVGSVPVPDERLDPLGRVLGSDRVVPTTVSVVDIAGLVSGASEGEGLGNRFLGHIREVDAIAHVLRAFDRGDVVRAQGPLDPIGDADLVETELILADLQTVRRRLEDLRAEAKSATPEARTRVAHAERLREKLESGAYLAREDLDLTERSLADEMRLLTRLPVLYVLNTGEPEATGFEETVADLQRRGGRVISLAAAFEDELAELEPGEREMFLEDAGLTRSGRERFIRAAHDLLGLITFFTGNEKETRAWSLEEGSTALEAAGKIHTDMARGFIRAEVVEAETLLEIGSRNEARRRGLLRVEGRDYRVREGDVLQILFNA